jgi:hypothetical protein
MMPLASTTQPEPAATLVSTCTTDGSTFCTTEEKSRKLLVPSLLTTVVEVEGAVTVYVTA